MKLSRHAITVLTRQYKSVLLKCALINAGLFLAVAPALAADAEFTIKTNGTTTVTAGDTNTTINLNNVNTAISDVATLQTTVGNSTSGLVKDVADNASDISSLKTTVGDSTSGLVKGVADLQTTVGDSTSGLVKGVNDLKDDVKMNADATSSAGYQQNDKVDSALAKVDAALKTAEDDLKMNADATSSAGYQQNDKVDSALAKVDAALKTAEDDLKMNADATSSAGYQQNDKVDSALAKVDAALKTAEDDLKMDAAATSSAGYAKNDKVDAALAAVDGALNKGETGLTNLTSLLTGNTYDKATGSIGTATITAKQADGTTTATNILEAVNATSAITQTQNTTLNALAGLIDGGSVDETGTRTAGTDTYAGAASSSYQTITDGTDSLVAAVGKVNSNLNNILITASGSQQGMVDDAKVGVTWNSNPESLETVLGNGVYTGAYNLTSGESIGESLVALDKAVGNRGNWSKNDAGTDLTVGTALAPNSSVSTAVSQLNVNIGDVSSLDVNGATTPTVVAAINKIDTNMEAVLGAIYKSDGTYDQAAIKGTNGFDNKATSNDLTKALKSYADNVVAATGVAFDEDGSVITTYTKATSVDYDGLNANSSLKAAIEQLDGNIGAATTAAKGNIASDNTVNQNLDSLDAAIGDRSFATTQYVAPHDDLSTAVTKLDKELHSVNHEVRELRHDMNRGLASVAALSALVPNARGTGNTSLSVGTGHYHGQTAMALGGAHWFTDNLMVNIGVASTMGHTRDATYRAGVSYSF